MDTYDLVIIGGGPAGYSAAIYAARYNMTAIVLAKQRGGLVTTTHLIENWPGEKSISGFDLMQKMEDHVKHLNVEIKDASVETIEKKSDGFIVKTGNDEFKGKTVLIATGTEHRKLSMPGAKELEGKGVSYCATCDGMFFKDKEVAIVGGGDSAAREALLLAGIASKVYVLVRRDEMRAEPINQERIKKKIESGEIVLMCNSQISKIVGEKKVEKIILDNGKELAVSGVFGAIGQRPVSNLAKELGVELDDRGQIKAGSSSETNIPGVYAAGDVINHPFKQAILASAQGICAVRSAHNFIGE